MVRKFIFVTAVCGALVFTAMDARAFGKQFAARPTQETAEKRVSSRRTATDPLREMATVNNEGQESRSIRKPTGPLTPLKPMIVPAATEKEVLDITATTTASDPPQLVLPQISLQAKVNPPIARFVIQSVHEVDSTNDAPVASSPSQSEDHSK